MKGEIESRSLEQRNKYIEKSCAYMCGIPFFEFGLWPYLFHIFVVSMSFIFFFLCEYVQQNKPGYFTSYCVITMGVVLVGMIIGCVWLKTNKSIHRFRIENAKRNKSVIRIDRDELKKNDTNKRSYAQQKQTHLNMHDIITRMGTVATCSKKNEYSDIESQQYHESKLMDTNTGMDLNDKHVVHDAEQPNECVDMETYYRHRAIQSAKRWNFIIRASTSKLIEATCILFGVFIWMIYGMMFSFDEKNMFSTSFHIVFSIISFVLTQTTYIQRLYNNLLLRYMFFLLCIIFMFIDPVKGMNVPSNGGFIQWARPLRLMLFFVIYCLVELDTTMQINYWMKFCDKKNMFRDVSELVDLPIGQINTPEDRRIYAVQRIITQSFYILFLPWFAWPFGIVHIIWLFYRIQNIVLENHEGMIKKYDDIAIMASGINQEEIGNDIEIHQMHTNVDKTRRLKKNKRLKLKRQPNRKKKNGFDAQTEHTNQKLIKKHPKQTIRKQHVNPRAKNSVIPPHLMRIQQDDDNIHSRKKHSFTNSKMVQMQTPKARLDECAIVIRKKQRRCIGKNGKFKNRGSHVSTPVLHSQDTHISEDLFA